MTQPDLWMKGLGRVLSWVGQDLPNQNIGGQESQREMELAELATRLLSQGGLSADDEATLELVRGTIQSARLERGLADQSAAALRLDLKSIQEELVGSRAEFNRVNHTKDEAESFLRDTRDQLEKSELALSTAMKSAEIQQNLIDEQKHSLEALRSNLNESKTTEKDARGELSTSVKVQQNVNDDLAEKLLENESLRKEIEDAKSQLQAGEVAFSTAQVELSRDLDDARSMREDAESGFHEAEKRAYHAEERANRAEEQVLRAKERAARAEEVSRHLEEVAAHSRRQAEEDQASLVELEKQLAEADVAISLGEEQLLAVRGRLDELNAGQLGKEGSIEDLEGVLEDLGHEGEDASILTGASEPARRMLRGLLERLRSELELSDQLREQVESKSNRLDSEESSHRRRVAELEAHRTRTESDLRETRHLLEEAERISEEVGAEHTKWKSRAQIAEEALNASEVRAQDAEERAAKAAEINAAMDEWEELARNAEQRAHAAEEKNAGLEIQKTHLREQQDLAEARASAAEETAIRSAMEAERAARAGEKALEALSRYEERCRRADLRAEEAHQASRAATAKKAAAEVLAAQARHQAGTAEQQVRALQRGATERGQHIEGLKAALGLRLAEVAKAKKEATAAHYKRELTQKQLTELQRDFARKEAALVAAEAQKISTKEASHLAVEAARAEMRAKLEKELAKKEQVLQEIRRELADKERSVAEQLAEADGKVALIDQARNEEIRKLRAAAEQRDKRRAEEIERVRAELTRMEDAERRAAALQDMLGQREAMLAESRQELGNSQQKLLQSQKELDETWTAKEGLRGEVARLEHDLETAKERALLSAQEQEAAQQVTPAAEEVLQPKQSASSPGVYSRSFRPQATQAVGMSPSVNTPSEEPTTEALYRDDEGEWEDPAGGSIEIEGTGGGSPPDLPDLDDLLKDMDGRSSSSFDNSDGKIYSAKRKEEDDDTSFSFFRRKK